MPKRCSSAAGNNSEQGEWLRYIKEVYPNRQSEIIFHPPGFLKPVPHTCAEYGGENIRVYTPPPPPPPSQSGSTQRQKRGRQRSESNSETPESPLQVAGRVYVSNSETLEDARVQESDKQDKDAMEWVLRHLYAFAKHRGHQRDPEVMMVISSLKFMKYLSLRNSASCAKYPRPSGAGEFDLIFINKEKGIIVCEVKSVKRADNMTDEEVYLKAIVKKVEEATAQLEKQASNLKEMVSDVDLSEAVTKSLILPNVTKQDLRQAMDRDRNVSQKLEECLGVENLEQALQKCLLRDHLTPCEAGRDVNVGIALDLIHWLNEVKARTPPLTESVYDTLLARFCGPMTQIEIATVSKPHRAIKTMGDYVGETGLRYSLLALYPSQLELLRSEDPMVFILGPPGTGKTVMLALKAKQWLVKNDGIKVHVVSTRYKGRAVSMLLLRQVELPPKGEQGFEGRVDVHHFDFNTEQDNVDKYVEELVGQVVGGELYVVIDEVGYRYRDRFKELCEKLKESVPSLHLWVADVKGDRIPDCLVRKEMLAMLRCPPVIHEEIKQSENIVVDSVRYSDDHVPHTHGPDPIWLKHRGVKGHSEGEPKSCFECGKMVASCLRSLGIGPAGKTRAESLQYRDVLIAYSNADDNEPPPENASSGSAAGPGKVPPIVEGLRSEGVDVRVLKRHDDMSVFRDVALAVQNKVVVSNWQNVSGLERRVVVGMGDLTSMDRFNVISRCTSQLIWIDHNVAQMPGTF